MNDATTTLTRAGRTTMMLRVAQTLAWAPSYYLPAVLASILHRAPKMTCDFVLGYIFEPLG